MPHTVAIVGGGVAGLAVAYELKERMARVPGGIEIVCLEAEDRPGGNIRSDRIDGYTCEWGPNGFLDNVPATLALVRRLGIEDRLLPSDRSAAIRFIYRGGRLRRLPSGALSFLVSDILSVPGRVRVLREPFVPARRDPSEESVFDFVSRRIGAESARILVDAMVSGIYAGDVRALSLQATFPKMWRMEADHGGLICAMLARRKEKGASAKSGGPAGPGGTLTSFRDGLEDLIHALARAAGPALRLGSRVVRVAGAGAGGFRVSLSRGEPVDAAAVVLACPAWFASELVSDLDAELGAAFAGIPSASVAVVHFGYDEADLASRPHGFGFLAPRGEGPRILGTLWSSSIFPGRAPAGKVLLTSMVGGAHDPEAVTFDDARLIEIVRRDLSRAMGIDAAPRFVRIFRQPRGIPQYTLGHMARLETIARRLAEHPGLLACGNSYRGISVNACVDEAPGIADAIVEAFARTPAAR
jgi:protoporphyrinogen/coproporphyrinogen III oxidase